ncbi:hypothetical protein NPIL_421841 [Nephila pilipes]|uniref:Uncharacterized protein n=1 Tax=Nephila pilipes TaxID=299642 RepID=A0A8X6IFE0_NEPPI|nr:hypothetical protein NPIL_421841 [Nephila pilipes]
MSDFMDFDGLKRACSTGQSSFSTWAFHGQTSTSFKKTDPKRRSSPVPRKKSSKRRHEGKAPTDLLLLIRPHVPDLKVRPHDPRISRGPDRTIPDLRGPTVDPQISRGPCTIPDLKSQTTAPDSRSPTA